MLLYAPGHGILVSFHKEVFIQLRSWVPANLPRLVTLRRVFSPVLLSFLVCSILVTVILYWRHPDAFYNPQLWAEDGTRFFSNAFLQGSQSLVMPFAGYFHTLARFVAWLVSWLPADEAPRWYALASWALLICIIAYVFSARLPFGLGTKLLLGLALVATTVDNEVFFNLANWATLTSLFWLLLSISSEPHSRLQWLFDVLLLVLTGLNSPFAVCLWLLFLLRWYMRRTRPSLSLLVLSLAVAAIQFWNMPARINAGNALPVWNEVFIDAVLYRFGFMFVGEQIYHLQLTDPLRLLGLSMLGLGYGGLFWHAVRQKNWSLWSVLAGGLLAGLLSLYVLRQTPGILIYSAGRHFFIPAVTVAWGLILSDIKPKFWRWLPLGMIWMAFLFLSPSNKNQVLPDLDWAGKTAECVGTRPACRIPINPVVDPPAWFATMNSHVFRAPVISNTLSVQFGEQIELVGYDWEETATTFDLKLVWRALGKMQTDYKFFVHVFNPNDPTQILLQEDLMPLGWQYPTSKWVPKEIIADQVTFSLANLPPGEYQVRAGWYDPNSPTLGRLTAHDLSSGKILQDDLAILPSKIVVP